MTPEKKVENEIAAALREAGCYVVNLVEPGRRGWADLAVFKNSKCVMLEIKKPGGGVVSVNQRVRQAEFVDAARSPWWVTDDVSIVQHVLEYLGEERYTTSKVHGERARRRASI